MPHRFAIIGAGMAGASVGYWLSQHESVLVLERELQPAYHRRASAAMFIGPTDHRSCVPLTVGSRPFYETPRRALPNTRFLSTWRVDDRHEAKRVAWKSVRNCARHGFALNASLRGSARTCPCAPLGTADWRHLRSRPD
jgi:glycine/D-amino acid oxidase-like deaminating enzyme